MGVSQHTVTIRVAEVRVDALSHVFFERNALVSIASVADRSNTPTSRFVIVSVTPSEGRASARPASSNAS
jgi:hypothetical protein